MNKNAIKSYAVWARNELRERVGKKMDQYEIHPDGDPNSDRVRGILLTETEKNQRQKVLARVKEEGMDQVTEEVAYTWFNRFCALWYMEVNNFLPSRIRVFTDEKNAFKPQILTEAVHLELDGLDREKVFELKEKNDEEELFKYLFITQCNALSDILPGMFQKIADDSELLFPDHLLRDGSVIDRMIKMIPAEDWLAQVQIIGWLYQYYISEKHDEVVDPLHGKVVKKEEIPAATQIFTTDWVVRYLIDNSVGRYWIERNPNSTLANKLTYFVKPKDGTIKMVDEKIIPQDVTTFDPCVGSGHFLVYAFDVLMKIYVEYGYSERDAASEIVKNNLFGLDIDGRASQLAYFSVMMKARQYDRHFFSRGIHPHIYEIMESNTADRSSLEHFYGDNVVLKKDIQALLDTLKDAKEYGSILQMPAVDFGKINERFEQLAGEISIYNTYLIDDFQSLICPAEVMSGKYAVVATNPPYLNKYDSKLKDFINANYKEHSGDLFSVFMYRNFGFCKSKGYSGFMAPFVWMFIKSYEPLRSLIIHEKSLTTLIQMEYSAFEEATVPICSFVFKNGRDDSRALCFKLSEFKGGMEVQKAKTLEAISNPSCGYFFEANTENFNRIPGSPISFWVSEALYKDFENKKIQDIEPPRFGMSTSDNNRFVRVWYEVSSERFAYPVTSLDSVDTSRKWYPYNNGGEFRRWYGDNGDVVNWERDGSEIKAFGRAAIRNKDFYYKAGITWTAISSAKISVRAFDYGFLFSSAGFCIFEENIKLYLLAFMNSIVGAEILRVLSPTINFNVGDIARLPVKVADDQRPAIEKITLDNISISRSDWDSFETSWDFQSHPLAPMSYERREQLSAGMNSEERKKEVTHLSERYRRWEQECEYRFSELKKNEEELNRIFIEIYGLQDELTPEVEDKDVTVRKADLQRDIRSLLSYAVGCMFGRYSLEVPGLAYAGGTWDDSKYTIFKPDKEAIIPICDDEYFDDDIVNRFVEFIRVVYGDDTLEENLKFIADALGGTGTSREVIRKYFLNDFYADHLKTYQKRPIYWLFDSGKKNGFKCLVYMHRCQPDTIARIRTDYVHEQQSRYRTAMEAVERQIANAHAGEHVRLNKRLSSLQEQAEETRVYEEKIHHLADQFISIDLDDGVKMNYAKFQDVLAKLK